MAPEWEDLCRRAERVVREIVDALPGDLKAEAEATPCLMDETVSDDPDDRALGRYFGFEEDHIGEGNGPIILYLWEIHDHCVENELEFELEVRRTYLHEFGHHLGWDEHDLDERGLQ